MFFTGVTRLCQSFIFASKIIHSSFYSRFWIKKSKGKPTLPTFCTLFFFFHIRCYQQYIFLCLGFHTATKYISLDIRVILLF